MVSGNFYAHQSEDEALVTYMLSQFTLICKSLNLEIERSLIEQKEKPYYLLEAFVNSYRNVKQLMDKIISNKDFKAACNSYLAESIVSEKEESQRARPFLISLTAME